LLRHDRDFAVFRLFPESLCALLYALRVFTVPCTDSLGQVTNFWMAFYFFAGWKFKNQDLTAITMR